MEVVQLDRLLQHKVFLFLINLCLLMTSATTAAQEQVTITHLHNSAHGAAWGQWLGDLAVEFMQDYPHIVIKILPTASDEYNTKLRTMYIANSGLDVVEVGLSGALQYKEGLFINLMPLLVNDAEVSKSLWPESVFDGFVYQGALWAVPMTIDLAINWYNEDLFDKAGLLTPNQLGKAWNWDYLSNASKKMTLDANGDGVIDQFGVDRAYAHWSNGNTLESAGARIYEQRVFPMQPNVNSPAAKAGLHWITDLYLIHQVTQPYGAANMAQYSFWTGKSAINIADNTNVLGRLSNVSFQWNVARPVAGPGGAGTTLQMTAFAVLANTQHPQEVWTWVKYLAARRSSVEQFIGSTGRLPAFKSAHSRFKELAPTVPNQWWLMFDVLNEATTYPAYLHIVSGLNQWKTAILQNQVFTGQKSPDVALDEAQALELRNVQVYLDAQAARGR